MTKQFAQRRALNYVKQANGDRADRIARARDLLVRVGWHLLAKQVERVRTGKAA